MYTMNQYLTALLHCYFLSYLIFKVLVETHLTVWKKDHDHCLETPPNRGDSKWRKNAA